MKRAVRNSRAAIFFFQAENDYDLFAEPDALGCDEGRWQGIRDQVLPPFGTSAQDGRTFGHFGSSIWGADVFRFWTSIAVSRPASLGPLFYSKTLEIQR